MLKPLSDTTKGDVLIIDSFSKNHKPKKLLYEVRDVEDLSKIGLYGFGVTIVRLSKDNQGWFSWGKGTWHHLKDGEFVSVKAINIGPLR